MNNKLKLCPACQSDELVIYETHKGSFYVQCENCEMRGPRKDDENAAIDAWNSLFSWNHIQKLCVDNMI